MPVARIVTRYPQCAAPACDFLQEHGYSVEVVDPGEFRLGPASFEFALEKCTAEQARARAEHALRAYESQAASRVIQGERQEQERVAVAFDITGRPVEFANPAEVREERRKRPNTFTSALVSFLGRNWDELDQSVTRATGSAREAVRDLWAHRAEHRQEKLQWRQAQAEEKVRREQELSEQRAAERARREEEQARIARQKEEEERQRRLAEADARERRRQAEVEAGMAWVRERQARLAAERDEEQKRREQERRAREEAEVRHRERQAQIAAQSEAEERARAEAERERARAAAEREAALAADRARAAAQAQPVEPPRSEPVLDAPPTWSTAVSRRPRPDIAPWHPPSSGPPASYTASHQERDRDWKKAFAVAAGAVILVMLGIMAYGNRRPASPFSTSEILRQNAIEQQSPFGPARLKPQVSPARPAAAGPSAPPTAAQAAAPRPSPQKPGPGRQRPIHTATEEDEEWVDDEEVVVRHYSQRRQPDRRVASSNGVKRYSDLD